MGETIRIHDRGLGAYVALPVAGHGPQLLVLQEIFGVNANVRHICEQFAEEGYVAVAPDLFWRQHPGIEIDPAAADGMDRALACLERFSDAEAMEDVAATIDYVRRRYATQGSVAAVGYCLGGRLALRCLHDTEISAAVAYYGVALESLVERALPAGKAALLHVAGLDEYCPPEAQARLRAAACSALKVYVYPECDHAFAREGSLHFRSGDARLAGDRTMNFLVPRGGPVYDLESLWEDHLDYEFATRDVDKTMATMVAEPYVNHIPTMTGGVGYTDLHRFYRDFFIGANPPDTAQLTVSRTIGARQVVDEVIFSFTHDRHIEWLLPGIEPTGRKIRFGLVGIVRFRGQRICHEHIYWDQASVLAQLGLLDPQQLPVVGAEGADKILDNGIASNRLIKVW